MYTLLLLICTLLSVLGSPFIHEITTNIQRFHHKHHKNHKQLLLPPVRLLDTFSSSKNVPEDLYVVIAEYLDHSSLLSFSAACKLYNQAASQYICNKLTSLSPFYFFPSDRLNRAMHAVLLKNSFFAKDICPMHYLIMLIYTFPRISPSLPHLPRDIYIHLIILIAAVSMSDLDTYQLVDAVHGIFDSIYPNEAKPFDRAFLIRALFEHKDTAIKCFFDSEFLQDISLENFNQILSTKLAEKDAQTLLKSINPSRYNQIPDKSLSSFRNYMKSVIVFLPTVGSFHTAIYEQFERLEGTRSSALLFALFSAYLTPETPAKVVLFWYTYTKYHSEYLYTYKARQYTWWSLFYSVVFEIIEIYPQHTAAILEITNCPTVEELHSIFIHDMNSHYDQALESSAFLGHTTTVTFLLSNYPFTENELNNALFRAASTEYTETISCLLSHHQFSPNALFSATREATTLNNIDSFRLLINYSKNSLDQTQFRTLFLCACRNHYIKIAEILLDMTSFTSEVFENAMNYVAHTADSEMFRFLLNQPYHRFDSQYFDDLLCIRSTNEEDINLLIELLRYTHLFSRAGVIEALRHATMHRNHKAIICILNYFVLTPSEGDLVLLNAINFGADCSASFLFQRGLIFTRKGLIDAFNVALRRKDELSCDLIENAIKQFHI